jgi:hypothetical protein
VQGIVGSNFPLDRYLAQNKRPKYLLAMFGAMSLQPNLQPFTEYAPEGIAFGLQYERTWSFYKGLLKHPKWLLKFDLWAGQMVLANFANHMPWMHAKSVDTRAQRAEGGGIWTYPLPAETYCVRSSEHVNRDYIFRYADSVNEFRQRYGVDGTQVFVNVSPVADCDQLQDFYRKLTDGLHDNAFEVLPIADFNEGDVHPDKVGSTLISEQVGEQILAVQKQDRGVDAGGRGKR